MIVPIAHDRSQVRRFPFATAALVVACAAVFLVCPHDLDALDAELHKALSETAAFVEQHPYLDPNAGQQADLMTACAARLHLLETGAAAQGQESREPQAQRQLDQLCEALAAAQQRHPYRAWGLIPARPRLHAWFTHGFLHGGWLHLGGTMLMLILAGFCLEELWGRTLFLALYTTALGVSAAVFAAIYPGRDVPLFGASGAVAALMGAFLVRCWDARITFFCFGLVTWGTFRAPAWVMLPLGFVVELGTAIAMDAWQPGAAGDGFAHWAHVAGFVYGMCAALLLHASGLEPRFIEPALERKNIVHHDRALADALALERAGDLNGAFELLRAALAERPQQREIAAALWALAARCGRAAEAAPALSAAIAQGISLGEWDHALADLAELGRHAPAAHVAAEALADLAGDLLEARRVDDAGYVLEIALARPHDAPFPADRALELVRAALALDAKLAVRAAALALEQPGATPSVQAALRALVEQAAARAEPPPAPESSWRDPRRQRASARHTAELGARGEIEGPVLDELEDAPRADAPWFDRGDGDLS